MTTMACLCRSFNLPLPNKETLSRHSFLGPNGLQGQWRGPSSKVKVDHQLYDYKFLLLWKNSFNQTTGQVHYPSSTELSPSENSR